MRNTTRRVLAGGVLAATVVAGVALAAPAQAESMFACGNATYVNENTTCAFAHNVTDAWFYSPGNQIGAYSPALGHDVVMDCAYVYTYYGDGEVCRGGNNAVVAFHP
jgi:hypothetical protein